MSRIKQDVVNELHKPARRRFMRRRVIIKGFDDLWQADLMEFLPHSRLNNGYKYILVVIDCFSKYLWTQPVKSKRGQDVRDAMEKILKGPRRAKNLQTDLGKEFYNTFFKNLMQKYDINHYSTYSTTKAAIAERVIRTLKDKLYREFSMRGEYKWIDILSTVTDQYNSLKHSTIKMRPRDVTIKHEKRLLNSVYNNIKISGLRRFRVGDVVRISKHKSVFDKGYTPNWSTELFIIEKAQITNPATYLLKDVSARPILGSFYEWELQKAKHPDVYLVEKVLRRKGDKVYVKWLGLNNLHNSWIDKHNVL